MQTIDNKPVNLLSTTSLVSKKAAVRKILITGPESTGKSTMAKALAAHLDTYYVPEYARSYLNYIQRPYTQQDVLQIAKGQALLEDAYMHIANKYLVVDTDMTVMAIWSQEKYGNINPWIAQELVSRTYDLILLMDADLPWVYDPQRENPNDRKRLLYLYRQSLEARGQAYYLISGDGKSRINNALKVVEQVFSLQDFVC